MGSGDSKEVTALAAFVSPTTFKKKLEYLVKISLEDDILVQFAKSLTTKVGLQYSPFETLKEKILNFSF